MAKVIVVGGGFAGVAAASALAEKGIAVELIESRGSLGGRVYSTENPSFPAPVDNGPHLFMGCYEETWKLFKRLGVKDAFHRIDPLKLIWLTDDRKKVSLSCAPLPAPFHLVWGLLTTNAFSWNEKVSLTKALLRFSKKPFSFPEDVQTVERFILFTEQGPQTIERFWIPLCNAVMNVPIDIAPLSGFAEVLHRVFFGKRSDSALVLAKKPLSDLGFAQIGNYIQIRGGLLRVHEGIQKFELTKENFTLTSRSDQIYQADAVIWAVPPASLSALWPQDGWAGPQNLPQLGKSPILSVHLILSQPVMTEPLAGLSGGQFEWVFNRDANWGRKGEGQYLSFVASAAENLGRLTEAELVNMVLQELKDRLPEGWNGKVLHAKVTREMAATFVWTNATGPLRLPCETPYPFVFLAGDWTDTGLPATIEGACLSGHKAAEKAAAYLLAKDL
jgi:zeta-carotene desaturase